MIQLRYNFCVFRDVKAIPLISASRWLVKRGDCTRISWKESAEKLTFGRRVHKHNLALFLFTDLLVVTKRKSDEKFLVLDYSPRNMIQVTELESSEGIPGLGEQPGFALWLTLLQNHENKTQEMLLSFCSESDRGRWMEAVTPASSQVRMMHVRNINSPRSCNIRYREKRFMRIGTVLR